MEKLGEIGVDIETGARATYNFWRHVFQLLIELFSFGYIHFEKDKEVFREQKLSEVQGTYLKLKFKNPPAESVAPEQPWFDMEKWTSDQNLGQEGELTPMENTMVNQDIFDGSDGLFIENSQQFMDDMQKINEMGALFMALGVLFALVSLLIYKRLKYKEGLKVDFSAQRRAEEREADQYDGSDHQENDVPNHIQLAGFDSQ